MVTFRPTLVSGVFWGGSFWARGAALGSLLGVGAEGWASERTGKGTVAQSGCQEAFGRPPRLQIRIAGCDHKGREQQASEVQIRTPASNPNSRLRSQGSPAVGFDANQLKGTGDDDHWLGGPSSSPGGQVSVKK